MVLERSHGRISRMLSASTGKKYGKDISDEEVNDCMKKHDLDGQHGIDFDEFKKMMLDD